MLSTRAIAVIGALAMVTATAAHAQGKDKHHAKDDDDEGDDDDEVNLGASFGLERNLTPWFSVSGALGGALNLTNSFKDIQFATTAKLAANLYWN